MTYREYAKSIDAARTDDEIDEMVNGLFGADAELGEPVETTNQYTKYEIGEYLLFANNSTYDVVDRVDEESGEVIEQWGLDYSGDDESTEETIEESIPEITYSEPETLDELFDLMQNDDPHLPDWDSLPIFSKNEIANTIDVWSWDDTRKIVGTCSDDIEIVDRDDLDL